MPASGSECFGHVPNQSALTEVFQDASKIGFNLHPWAVTDTVGVSQFRKADGVVLHQFNAPVQLHQFRGSPQNSYLQKNDWFYYP